MALQSRRRVRTGSKSSDCFTKRHQSTISNDYLLVVFGSSGSAGSSSPSGVRRAPPALVSGYLVAVLAFALFGNLNPTNGRGLRGKGAGKFPNHPKMKLAHGLMQSPEVSAHDGHYAMTVMQVEFGLSLIHLRVQKPGIRNKPAPRGKMEGDALRSKGGITLEAGRLRRWKFE